jgi:AraC family transcriptional activator of pobA
MEIIPIRHIHEIQKEPDLSESFSIRNLKELPDGKDMVQELHRHDFFHILAMEKVTGNHVIDFVPYDVCDNSAFFIK